MISEASLNAAPIEIPSKAVNLYQDMARSPPKVSKLKTYMKEWGIDGKTKRRSSRREEASSDHLMFPFGNFAD